MAGYYHGNPWSNNRSFYPSCSYSDDYSPSNFYHPCSNPNLSHYRRPTPTPVAKPRVVSIPVRYVDSPGQAPIRPSPEVAALRLQKVIRGFLVRKNVRTVRKIEAEAEEIAREIDEKGEVLERDEKTRIRFGEMLMRLLFKLDSVRGVRDYRKKVIKMVISLQEKIDSIGAREGNYKQEIVENDDYDPIEVETSNLPSDSDQLIEQHLDSLQLDPKKAAETVNSTAISPNLDPIASMEDSMEESQNQIDPMDPSIPSVKNQFGEKSVAESSDMEMKGMREVMGSSKPSETERFGGKSDEKVPESEMKGMREVMEKMAAESEKMKELMEEICRRSTQQWRLTEGLVDRVHRLEKAVERMERRGKMKKGNKNKCKQQWNCK